MLKIWDLGELLWFRYWPWEVSGVTHYKTSWRRAFLEPLAFHLKTVLERRKGLTGNKCPFKEIKSNYSHFVLVSQKRTVSEKFKVNAQRYSDSLELNFPQNMTNVQSSSAQFFPGFETILHGWTHRGKAADTSYRINIFLLLPMPEIRKIFWSGQ